MPIYFFPFNYFKTFHNVVVVQSLSHIQCSATPGTAAQQAPLTFTIFLSLLKFMSTESVMLSNHLILCPAPFSFCLQSFPVSGFFPKESALHIRWSKYWSFSISPSNKYLDLISFGIDWFDLLVAQGTLKSLLKHHNSKASILQ